MKFFMKHPAIEKKALKIFAPWSKNCCSIRANTWKWLKIVHIISLFSIGTGVHALFRLRN